MQALREHVVRPVLGDVESITRSQWQELTARSDDYFAWQAAKPQVRILEVLSVERVVELVEQGVQPRLLELVARDLEVAEARSEEHTSELQSRPHLVCRLLLEKKKKNK